MALSKQAKAYELKLMEAQSAHNEAMLSLEEINKERHEALQKQHDGLESALEALQMQYNLEKTSFHAELTNIRAASEETKTCYLQQVSEHKQQIGALSEKVLQLFVLLIFEKM